MTLAFLAPLPLPSLATTKATPMKAAADATLRRNALHDAVRRVLPKSRKPVAASVTLGPGEAGALVVSSDFGVSASVPIEGEWAAKVSLGGAGLLAILKAGMPLKLRLTWHGDVLMIGPTSLRALGRYVDPAAPDEAADGFRLTPPPGPGEEPPKRRGRRPKPPPVRYSRLMPDDWP